MPTLNLNQATKLYYGNTEVNKLYKGNQLLYLQDPYSSNVQLYIKGQGTNNSTSILDSSPNPKTITVVGNTKISTDQSKYGGSSIYFDGTGDYLEVVNPSALSIALNEDFTIEAWQKLANATSTYNLLSLSTSSSRGFKTGGSSGQVYANNTPTINVSGSITNNTNWNHIAFSRQGANLRVFFNGVLCSNIANSSPTQNLAFDVCHIGRKMTSHYVDFSGYLSHFRYTKGVARYTTNFNPETDTYLAY